MADSWDAPAPSAPPPAASANEPYQALAFHDIGGGVTEVHYLSGGVTSRFNVRTDYPPFQTLMALLDGYITDAKGYPS